MPQSLFRICTHLIWSTKKHVRFLHDPVRSEIHAHMAGILRKLQCEAVNVGGTEDHVHVVCFMTKHHLPTEVIRTAKCVTSRRIKEMSPDLKDFAWQKGYGIFSVGPADFDTAVAYVRNQQEHHREMTFREEFMRFVRKYNIPHDERYMWD